MSEGGAYPGERDGPIAFMASNRVAATAILQPFMKWGSGGISAPA